MAGQEIEGDLWDQSLGLDLLPPTECSGSLAAKNWNSSHYAETADLQYS